ncbi:sentrin-specific protease 7 [Rhinophrynus dorsalis]
MMDKHRKESSLSSPANGRASRFRIPKKKADDWSEDVAVNSPLSRLAETSFRNVTTRKRTFPSSYDSFNATRNKDSTAYYMSKYGSNRFSRQPKILLTDIRKTGFGRHSARSSTGSNSCNESNFKISHISSLASNNSEALQTFDDQQESLSLSRQELELHLLDMVRSLKYYVYRIQPFQKSDSLFVFPECPCAGHTASKNDSKNKVISSLSKSSCEKTYCHKRAEQLQIKTAATSPKVLPQIDTNCINSSSVEQRLHSSTDSSNTDMVSTAKGNSRTKLTEETSNDRSSLRFKMDKLHLDVQGNTMHRRKVHTNNTSKEESSSSEPIVLSSDEEERQQGESAETVCVRVIEEPVCEMKEIDKSKEPHQSPHNDTSVPKDLPDCTGISFSGEAGCQVLELKFLNVYIGKKKGRATGTAKFSTKSIDIPLSIALKKSMCLSLDAMKLQRFGLWTTRAGDCVRSNAIIFLWITSDYVQDIDKQMETSTARPTSSSSEFIFLELKDTPTKKEQDLLIEIMKEASKKGLSTLGDLMSWEKAYPMLIGLSHEESSFMENCFSEFQKQQSEPSGSQILSETSQQASRKKSSPSTYSLLHRYRDGLYSASLVPKQDNGWTEMRNTGSLLKLIVYPPPPEKGGLGVTNEDLECLEHGEFLNDVIIDFYLKYLLLEKFPKPFAERCHIFSSFFYKCLTRKDNGSSDSNPNLSASQRRHQRVKTWTRHVDIFKKDFIFVPVNENSHWYLAVICFPGLEHTVYENRRELASNSPSCKQAGETSNKGSVIVFNDKLAKEEETMGGESNSEDSSSHSPLSGSNGAPNCHEPKQRHSGKVCKRPCLLIFDSLKTASVQTTVQVLREYLKVEWDVKRKTAREFSRSNMRDLYPKVPKQNNSTDCGLYLLQYVESFYQKPIENFDPPMHLENWFPLCVVKRKREEIRDLILQLHLQQRRCS